MSPCGASGQPRERRAWIVALRPLDPALRAHDPVHSGSGMQYRTTAPSGQGRLDGGRRGTITGLNALTRFFVRVRSSMAIGVGGRESLWSVALGRRLRARPRLLVKRDRVTRWHWIDGRDINEVRGGGHCGSRSSPDWGEDLRRAIRRQLSEAGGSHPPPATWSSAPKHPRGEGPDETYLEATSALH